MIIRVRKVTKVRQLHYIGEVGKWNHLSMTTTTTTTTNVHHYSATITAVSGALYKVWIQNRCTAQRRRPPTVRTDSGVQVSRITDGKGETWSFSDMSQVRNRPKSLVADCSMPALQPPERRGAKGSPTSRRLLQYRGVSRAKTATIRDCPSNTLPSPIVRVIG